MYAKLPIVVLILFSYCRLSAQAEYDSTTISMITSYYKQGVQLKDGISGSIDYDGAFYNFSQAASLGDEQSIYAIAYLYFKGLGCKQDYTKAAQLFSRGAWLKRDNSMYFYGLCWRNGYGVDKNEDSAKYWLNKSAATGYLQAIKELEMPIGENINDSAAKLVNQISNAAMPDKKALNKFNKIRHYMPPTEAIAGEYRGFVIQYDWSGKNIASSRALRLKLNLKGRNLSGLWIEDWIDTVKVSAVLASDSIRFMNMQYNRKDHYSPDNGIKYNFQQAFLNMVQSEDTIFLAGNVEMFSPQRKEPSKPLMIVLSRVDSLVMVKKINLRTYPNPFNSLLTAQFEIPKSDYVEIQMLTLDGIPIYRNSAGLLEPGHYSFPLKINNVTSGTYLMKFTYGKHVQVVKVLKQ